MLSGLVGCWMNWSDVGPVGGMLGGSVGCVGSLEGCCLC